MGNFSNLTIKKVRTKAQKEKEGIVVTNRGGRPKTPNIKRYEMRMDVQLHARLLNIAKKRGVGKSYLVSEATREYLDKFE